MHNIVIFANFAQYYSYVFIFNMSSVLCPVNLLLVCHFCQSCRASNGEQAIAKVGTLPA